MDDKLNRLKELLDPMLEDVTVSAGLKNRIRMGVSQKRTQRKLFYGITASAAACVLMVTLLLPTLRKPEKLVDATPPVSANGAIQLVADQNSDGMIQADTGFLLTLSNPDEVVSLDHPVVFFPDVEYKVEKKSDDSYYIKPDTLSANTVYRVALNQENEPAPLSWAFQTTGSLSVVSTLPTSTSQVPIRTGIEFCMSGACTQFENYFSISPSVEGTFEYEGKTVSFVPAQPLAADTVYTVTLKEGVSDQAGRTLQEAYTFSFRTAMETSTYNVSLASGFSESFLPDDPIAISTYSDREVLGAAVTVKVYQLTAQEYETIINEQLRAINPEFGRDSDYTADISSYQQELSFETTLQIPENQSYLSYIVFPDTLAEGHYIADVSIQTDSRPIRLQKMIQISPLAIYTESQNGETLVWVNNANTGAVVTDAAVNVDESAGKTDENGLVSLENGNRFNSILTVQAETSNYVSSFPSAATDELPASQLYYSILYTDRQAYLSSDTINFWGVVQPRTDAALPKTVTLSLNGVYTTTVALDETGAYSGSLSYTASEDSYASLSLLIDGSQAQSSFLSIANYEKPAYVLTVETDKKYYMPGDSVTATILGTFYDGTPAKGKTVALSLNGEQDDKYLSVILDDSGLATATFQLPASSSPFSVGSFTIFAELYQGENVLSNGSAYCAYFPSGYLASAQMETDRFGFTLQTAALNQEAADLVTERYDYYDLEQMAGKAADMTGEVSIYRHEYVATESGQYYDFINKETRKTYSYTYTETLVDTFAIQTENGAYSSPDLQYPLDPSAYYTARILLTSPNGMSGQLTCYLSTVVNFSFDNPCFYYFTALDASQDDAFRFNAEHPLSVKALASTGEELTGTTLFSLVQTSALNNAVSTSSEVSFDFAENQIPNATVYGAYFDGRHIYEVSPASFYYDYASHELEITLKTDKTSYLPGETVQAAVTVTDLSGRPVKANFVLSVVDEAAFAIQDQINNPLVQLYQPHYYSPVYTSVSYLNYDELSRDNAEGGGEGISEGIRRKFVDTASFQSGQSDADGKATLSFQLPDNLTSWRLTAVAADNSVRAGTETTNITTTIPFFVTPVLNSRYLQGDEVTLSMRAAGIDLSSTDKVQYKVTLKKGATEETKEASGAAGAFTYLDFGKLPSGQYTVLLEGKSGSLSDRMELTFEVKDTLLSMVQSKRISLSELSSLEATAYPVYAVFYDEKHTFYLDALDFLQGGNAGRRTDVLAARNLAYDKLQTLGINPYFDEESLKDLQEFGQGVKLLSHGSEDLLLTARLCLATPDEINLAYAQEAFWRVIYNKGSDSTQVAASYLGLAAIGEPVLYDILRLMATDLSLSDKLILATALGALGDQQNASSFFENSIQPLLQKQGQWSYVSIDGKADYALTAQAATLACLIRSPACQSLYQYILDNTSKTYCAALDVATYISKTPLPPKSDASFSYTKDGQKQTISLGEDGVYADRFSKQQLEEASFQTISGTVSVLATFTGNVDDIETPSDGTISVEKSYTDLGDSLTQVTLTLHFDPTAPLGGYSLTDVIPSGARFVQLGDGSPTLSYGKGYYFIAENDGKITFSVNPSVYSYTAGTTEFQPTITVSYQIRTALPGTYVTEHASLVYEQTGMTALAPRGSIKLS